MGTAAELLLLKHYDSALQLIPLTLIALAIPALAWHGLSDTTGSRRALQATMALFVIAGVLGVWLHYRGAAEFQLEIDRRSTDGRCGGRRSARWRRRCSRQGS